MPTRNLDLSNSNFSPATPSIVFGEARYSPGGTCGPRIQHDFQLVAMLNGAAQVELGARSARRVLEIPEHHVAMLRPGEREHFKFDLRRPVHHSWCALGIDFVTQRDVERIQATPQVHKLTPRMRRLMELGLSIPSSERPEAEALLSHLGTCVIECFLLEASSESKRSEQPDAIVRALAYIESNLHAPMQIEELAAECFISKQHLIRLFRAHLGTTPARYLWNVRTTKGAELLRDTGLAVAEIAHHVGFQSPFHFSRLIRQQFGESPKALRERAWNRGG